MSLQKVVGYPFRFADVLAQYESEFKTSENEKFIEENYKNITEFLNDVNENIKKNFDANYGINWDVINDSIKETLKGENNGN